MAGRLVSRVAEGAGGVDAIRALQASMDDDLARASLRALLKRAVDGREQERLAAVSCLADHVLARLTPDEYMPLVMPVVAYRTGKETAESVRLALLRLVQPVAILGTSSHWTPDVASHLIQSVSDPEPDVVVESLRLLTTQADRRSGRCRVDALLAKRVIADAADRVRHRHSRVRVAAVKCIESWMYIPGAAESIRDLAAFRESNVIPISDFYGTSPARTNTFALLVADGNASVRAAFFAMMARWMTSLPDRYDYEALLTPYLLSALIDASDAIVQRGIDAVDAVGRLYEEDHADDLYDRQRFDGELQQWKPAQPVLAGPIRRRPALGARIVVAAQLPRLLPAILGTRDDAADALTVADGVAVELGDWQEGTRRSALSLLRVLLVYAEAKAAVHAWPILRGLIRAGDGGGEMGADCARLIGHHVRPEAWIADMALYVKAHDEEREQVVRVAEHCLAAVTSLSDLAGHVADVNAILNEVPDDDRSLVWADLQQWLTAEEQQI
ncbi:hypothetical protein PBRA_007843 [Plasmodiophora brassicae]|uniref:HEAT repeat domain-containing protein n=1 Tax=Plasmodiophora brassicae TaxID=37360 RepID=A0A0G4IYF3_PLABS|nr:hypothetical protein PBRA_007843 [Plasmodiophora brassicae]